MGTELISSALDENGTITYDLALTRVVAGDVERVRAGLAEALERLGYHVVEERPLVAKRRTGRWAAWGGCVNVLKAPTTLHVKVQSAGSAATRVTFNYTVRASMMTGGDRRVLAREVDAAVALAASRDRDGACTLCGTEFAGDSRFCRRCGAPLATYEPAELETLRLAAGAHSAARSVGNGALFVMLGIAAFALTLFVPQMAHNPAKMELLLTLLAWSLGGLGIVALMRGFFQMRRTLDDGRGDAASLPHRSETGRLPAVSGEYLSVTERTTGLLEPTIERAPEPIPLRRRTGDMN